MKKSKILIPTFAIAGLATSLSPLITMTSCTTLTKITAEWNSETSLFEYKTKDGTYLGKGKYEVSFEVTPEHPLLFIKLLCNDESFPILKLFDSIAVTYGGEKLENDKDYYVYTTQVWFTSQLTEAKTLTLTFSLSRKDTGQINIIKGYPTDAQL